MTIYCGVDFHARQQTVCYCDTAGGEIRLAEQDYTQDDVGGFYSALAGEVVVGIEASGYSTWFVERSCCSNCSEPRKAQGDFESGGDSEQPSDELRAPGDPWLVVKRMFWCLPLLRCYCICCCRGSV